jgi:hypothetical protein
LKLQIGYKQLRRDFKARKINQETLFLSHVSQTFGNRKRMQALVLKDTQKPGKAKKHYFLAMFPEL